MKKIGFILPSLKRSGPGLVVYEIANGIKDNFDITILYFDDKEPSIDFSFVKTEKINFFNYKMLRDFDIVHSHGLRPDIFNSLWVKDALKISTLHNYIKEDIGYLYSKIVGFIVEKIWIYFLKNLNIIVCLTEHMKSYYSNSLNRIEVIHNARILESSFKVSSLVSKIESFKKNSVILGMVCSIIKRKGFDKAFQVLLSNPKTKLIVIGDGQDKIECISKSEQLGISDRILWLGFIDNPNVYMTYFDYYLLVSNSEGYPLSAIEAGLLKIPILSIKTALYLEIFGNNVFYLQNDFILDINVSKTEREKKTSQFYSKLINDKNYNKMIEKYTKLYI